jgi:uroporphyrin-III C-methyltransferase
MRPLPQTTQTSHSPLLISLDSASHVHLIIGSNPVAAARCSKSFEVGAEPIVIAPDVEVHYTLSKRFEEGTARWVQKNYEDEDLKTLGRAEVDGVVDAVFVTLGPRHPLSRIHMA